MSLSVEQILNECREESLPQTFDLEKEASASSSSVVNADEVAEMVSLLKEAAVPGQATLAHPPGVESNIYEKVAEAAIINGVLQTIGEESVKVAEFRENALNSGYDHQEIDALIEKRATASALKNIFKAKNAVTALKGLGLAGGATAVGVGGYRAGKKDERKTTKLVGRASFSAGRKYQYARTRALAERRQRLRAYLKRRAANQGQ